MLQKIQCSLHLLSFTYLIYESAASVRSFVVIEKGDHAKLRLALRDRLCGCLITQFCSQPWVFWAEHAHEDETTNKVRVCHSWNFEISLQNSYQRCHQIQYLHVHDKKWQNLENTALNCVMNLFEKHHKRVTYDKRQKATNQLVWYGLFWLVSFIIQYLLPS